MANNNDIVEIPVEIDISDAKEQLEQLRNAIKALNANTDDTEEQVKALEKQYDILSEYIEQAEKEQGKLSNTVDNTNKSFKNQTKELNDVKDVTDFAGQSVNSLGLEETALGEAINTTTGFIGKSIGFIKNAAKALDALKKSITGANTASNKFKSIIDAIAKHSVLIVLSALAATLAIVYKRFKDLEQINFDKRLGVIDRNTELLNEKLENQINILNLLGAKQSTITQQQISNLEELNDRLKETQGYYQEMWNKTKYSKEFDLGYLANEYLKGNEGLMDKLNDNAKELVKKYAEAEDQIRKNNIQLDTMKKYTLEINILLEDVKESNKNLDETLYSIANKYDKQIQKLNNQLDKQTALNELEEEKNGYATNYLENLQKQFDVENRISDLELARSNEEIEAYDKKLKSIEKQIVDAEKLGLVEQKENLLAEKRNVLEQKRNIETNKSIILTQKSLRQIQMEAEVYRSMIDNVKTFNDLFLQSRERLLGFMDFNAFDKTTLTEYLNEYKKLFNNINTIYDEFKLNTTDVFNKVKKLYEEDTNNILYAYVKAGNAIDEINSGIDKDGKELTKERKAELIDFISSVNNAMQEYYQINDNISNNLEDRALKMMSTIKDRLENVPITLSGAIERPFNKPLFDFRKELDATLEYYNALMDETVDKLTETSEEFKDKLEYVNDEILQYLKDGKEDALKTISSLLDSIDKEMTNFSIKNSEGWLEYWNNYVDELYKYQSVYGNSLSYIQYYEQVVLDAEKTHRMNLLSEKVDALRKSGVEEIDIQKYISSEKLKIDETYYKDSALLNQKYKQEYLNIASDLTGNLQTISENAFQLNDEMSKDDFERHKKIQGATLVASTYAQAAQAFGSTFAQAPGGVAAKTIQAGIASAAVMASGIAAYNRLMSTTQNSTMDTNTNSNISASTTAVETGTSSVARTLVGGRYETYAREGGVQTVLVVDEVTAKQMESSNIKKVSVI